MLYLSNLKVLFETSKLLIYIRLKQNYFQKYPITAQSPNSFVFYVLYCRQIKQIK